MKGQLSSLDLHFLVRELQSLVGARLDKAYQGTGERKRDLLLQFHKKDKGKGLLRILLPGLVYMTEAKPEYDAMPGQFATFLRRHVGNARLIGVEQKGFERLLELKLENKDGIFTLVLELLPPGNGLLLNNQGKIINLLEPQKTSSRVLRGGAVYEPPPLLFDTKGATADMIVERLFSSTKDSIVKSLAIDLGLGGDYAEEVCSRAGVEKSRKDLSREELGRIATAMKGIFEERISPSANDEEAFPVAMRTKETITSFPSFSQAIETIVPDEPVLRAVKAEAKTRRAKATDVVKHQELALTGLLKAAEENQRKGELLYEHYEEVERLLHDIKEAHKTMSWADLKKKFPNVTIDEQKGHVTIELGTKE
jgi:predicted ribosome quality control (RQC) complex YloA/Tae2 family protein